MRMSILIAMILASVSVATANGKEGQSIFVKPTSTLSIHPSNQHGALYGRERANAAWHVAQWNNPSGDIEDFSKGSASNYSLSVAVNSSPLPTISIRQNGTLLQCDDAGIPREFDGLIGTNTKENNPGVPSAELNILQKDTLKSYRSVIQTINMKLLSAGVLPNACPTSKAVSLFCIVFTNHINSTSFFFQIIIYSLNTNPHNIWWAQGKKGGRFGYNYVLPSIRSSWAVGKVKSIDLDIIPIITNVINNNDVGLDKNLADWRITGSYFGNAIYGNVYIETQWSGYDLSAVRF